MSWDGYHHHVALNTWNQRRDAHPSEALGLQSITATLPVSDAEGIRQRAVDRDITVEEADRGYRLADPDGIMWKIRT